MTVIEYMEKHNLNQHQLARVLGVAQSLVNRATLPDQTFAKRTVELFATIGVELKEIDRSKAIIKGLKTKQENNKSRKTESIKKKPKRDSIIKDFQLEAVRNLGNTIVSKKYPIEKIIDEFKKFGLNVHVRTFNNSFDMVGSTDTHYVVELDK